MKKYTLTLLIFILLSAVQAHAQKLIAVIDYDAALKHTVEYNQAQESIKNMRLQYDKEMQRSADEFNAKYEYFLDEYKELAPSILQKRLGELQQIIANNTEFKEKADEMLSSFEQKAMQPAKEKLSRTISDVARAKGFAITINLNNDNCPYFNSDMCENITEEVINHLK